jgi:fructokinase
MLLPVRHLHVLSLGEVLWDIFGETRHLGGAPFNFAYHCAALRTHCEVATRVGHDQAGQDIVERACEIGVSPRLIQVDPDHPTGTVTVTLDAAGVPSYVIHESVAWDFLEVTYHATQAAESANIICFGTLAQRHEVSRAAIRAILSRAPAKALRVLDINLRQHYYSEALIRESLIRADLLKLNDEEFAVLTSMFGLPPDDDAATRQLMTDYSLRTIVVTRGGAGAVAWSGDERAELPGISVGVADTVGSGDAFTAVFATQLAAGAPLAVALRYANAAGAYVATQAGATPEISAAIIEDFAR